MVDRFPLIVLTPVLKMLTVDSGSVCTIICQVLSILTEQLSLYGVEKKQLS